LKPVEERSVAPLKRLDGEPVFDEPWQAQVLAMADALIENGTITPEQWSSALGDELRRARKDGEKDSIETYYLAALRALEHMAIENCAIDAEAVGRRQREWEEAYEATPHGHPVLLKGR
jgi:nitrile hydratase accessory protein